MSCSGTEARGSTGGCGCQSNGMDWGQQGFTIREDETFMVPAPSMFAGWKSGYGPECGCGGRGRCACGAATGYIDTQEGGGAALWTQGFGLPDAVRVSQWAAAGDTPVPPTPMVTPFTEVPCPEYCLLAFDNLLACVNSLELLSNDYYDAARLECIRLKEVYDLVCGSISGCPNIEIPPPSGTWTRQVEAEQWIEWRPVKICGPDVTNYLVKELVGLWYNGPAAALIDVNTGGSTDFKDYAKGKGLKRDCPKGCPGSIGLCGRCVQNHVPGNIALGSTAGPGGARVVGETIQSARHIFFPSESPDDAPDDIAAYDVGTEVLRAFDAMYSAPPIPSASREEVIIRDVMCKALGAAIGAGAIPEKKDCTPCGDSWP